MAATGKDAGFLSSLGLGPVNETALYQQGLMRGTPQGSGAAATFYNIGTRAGGMMRPAAQGVIGAMQGKGFQESAQLAKDQVVAQEMGIDVNMLRARREIRDRLNEVTVPNTGDPLDDQMTVAKEAVRIANEVGDVETASTALQRLTNLRQQRLEFERAGLAKESDILNNRRAYNLAEREQFLGAAGTLVGSPDKLIHYRLVTDPDSPHHGQFEVFHGDRMVEYKDGGVIPAGATVSDRRNKDDIYDHIRRYRTPKSLQAEQESIRSIAERGTTVGDIVDLFATSPDPQRFLGAAGKLLVGADMAIRTVDSVAGMIGDRALTWENADGKTTARFGSAAEMQKRAIEAAENVIESIPIAESWENIKETMGAEQFNAMIMELAFLDARLMEPSNRGLSDKDIENSLKRLVGGTANPVSFLMRQKQWVGNMEAKIKSFGGLIPTTDEFTTEQIRAAMVNPKYLTATEEHLAGLRTKIDNEIDRIQGIQTLPPEVGEVPEVGEIRDGFIFQGGDPGDPNSWVAEKPAS